MTRQQSTTFPYQAPTDSPAAAAGEPAVREQVLDRLAQLASIVRDDYRHGPSGDWLDDPLDGIKDEAADTLARIDLAAAPADPRLLLAVIWFAYRVDMDDACLNYLLRVIPQLHPADDADALEGYGTAAGLADNTGRLDLSVRLACRQYCGLAKLGDSRETAAALGLLQRLAHQAGWCRIAREAAARRLQLCLRPLPRAAPHTAAAAVDAAHAQRHALTSMLEILILCGFDERAVETASRFRHLLIEPDHPMKDILSIGWHVGPQQRSEHQRQCRAPGPDAGRPRSARRSGEQWDALLYGFAKAPATPKRPYHADVLGKPLQQVEGPRTTR
ncbi:hypothetical protein ACQP2F_33250 [Actinoplanes sp. CA-030573]|uniref:hypothetical protein n=1 Tax=Actinoplanes sp. CA-030573 TaxID=3239898 RepID=UPI003D8FE47A